MTITKKCPQCNEIKPISEFGKNSAKKDGINYACKACNRAYTKQYTIDNKEKIKKKRIKARKENPQKFKHINRKSHLKNIEKRKAKNKEWRDKNKEKRSIDNKKWREKNKEKRKIQLREWKRNKIKSDPIFKLHNLMSNHIRRDLKSNKGRKAGAKIWDYLPYSLEELKIHIESKFEVWMNWNNWSTYNPITWDDHKPSTWTWQVDHIKPHSTFKYATMDCQEFRDCWALSNLRPFNAKLNLLDGVNRTRHY